MVDEVVRGLLTAILIVANPMSAAAQPAAPDALSVDELLDVRQPAHQSPAVLSPDGQWLAWVETGAVRLVGSTERLLRHDFPGLATIRIVNTRTRKVRTVSSGDENAWAPAWSPDGSRLAFLSNRGDGARLRIYDLVRSDTRTPVERRIWTAWLRNAPVWLPDGTGIVSKFVPSSSTYDEMLRRSADRAADHRTEHADGAIRVYDHRPDRSEEAPTPGWLSARYGGDLGIVRWRDPEVLPLTQGSVPTWWDVSRDGRYVGFVEFADNSRLTAGFRLGFVDLESGATRRTDSALGLSFGEAVSWSPAGHLVALVGTGSGKDAGLLVANARDASIRRLAESQPGWSRDLDGPVWSPDAAELWFTTSGGVDIVDAVSGEHRRVNTPPELRIEEILTARRLGVTADSTGNVPVSFDSTSTGGRHIGLLDFRTGEVTHLAAPHGESSFEFHSDLSEDGRLLTFRTSAVDSPPEYALLDVREASIRRLTDMNPTFESAALAQGCIIKWRTAAASEELEGALFLPGGDLPGTPLPLIVDVYGGQVARDVLREFSLQRSALVSRGYAVLVPDMPLDGHDPLGDHVAAVVPAVRTMIERGIADSTRLGLTGHSYGGYGTVALLARTDLFDAAVASAAHANLAGMFSHLSPDGIVNTQWAEYGQGRMQGAPWDVPDRYVKNSVLFSMNDVSAPLLLIHGAEDGNTPAYLAGEIFTSLRRLDRRVQLAVHDGEGHWPKAWSRESQRDYWTRFLSWFDEHLAGER